MTQTVRPIASHHWLLVLCLVGLDYFSTLAYLPSIAVESVGALAPHAALVIVLITLCVGVPVYAFVVGRSPHGLGATGLLERTVSGWRGKLLVLTLLGFVATDFVVTRSLSTADAAIHLLQNSQVQRVADFAAAGTAAIGAAEPSGWDRIRALCTRQIAVTVVLSIGGFGFWLLMQDGLTGTVLRLAAVVVGVYLAVSGVVIVSGLIHVLGTPAVLANWRRDVVAETAGQRSIPWMVALMGIRSFPPMALGISGFELSMTVAPMVRGRPDDTTENPRGRTANCRKLMVLAAVVMGAYLTGGVFVSTLLVPHQAVALDGAARHRTLAYLAHGGTLTSGQSGTVLNPLFGPVFGSLYDVATATILCLAGASVMLGLRGLVPQYLHRTGMEMDWAHRTGVTMHLFNSIIVVVTLVFRASVSAQQWAYATSVLVLLGGASLAAFLDLRLRWSTSRWRAVVVAPAGAACGFFLTMTAVTVLVNVSGLAIASAFVVSLLSASLVSRWIRNTELRFQGFEFADADSESRWDEIRHLPFQVLITHRPGLFALAERHAEVRRVHRIPPATRVVFIEAELGDPSDFYHKPRMQVVDVSGLEVIRVSCCTSVAHVIAAIGLEFRRVGEPPEIIFGWSHESPLASNLNFLLLGEGNIPWLVRSLIRNAEPDAKRQPRVVIA